MKKLFMIGIVALAILNSCYNRPNNITDDPTARESVYDSILAKKLGADEYGMRQYIMAFLKKGPNRNQDSATAVKLQRAHLDNITRMAKEGTLILAGPFLDSGDIRGIYIFDVRTVEEAHALTATDPAIQAGRLKMELHPWYGSAALMQIPEISRSIAKKEI
ncbi:MAG: YciI family protein [Bacteroidetes bacterium]|nr:YciI family protein [Bacteroidota bacterium]